MVIHNHVGTALRNDGHSAHTDHVGNVLVDDGHFSHT